MIRLIGSFAVWGNGFVGSLERGDGMRFLCDEIPRLGVHV